MKITTTQVSGLKEAMIAMRNPMNSWVKNDSGYAYTDGDGEFFNASFTVGPNDKELSLKLQKAGPEHAKHLRLIQAWATIEAPRFWLIELDTYRMGVEKVSCSTMHKLLDRPLTIEDFEHSPRSETALNAFILNLNWMMEEYKAEDNPAIAKDIWRGIIEILPQSYIQKRNYMFSYAALRNIIAQRQNHKLKEWHEFIDWCHTLPCSWMLFD